MATLLLVSLALLSGHHLPDSGPSDSWVDRAAFAPVPFDAQEPLCVIRDDAADEENNEEEECGQEPANCLSAFWRDVCQLTFSPHPDRTLRPLLALDRRQPPRSPPRAISTL